jgi:hypothetical protein
LAGSAIPKEVAHALGILVINWNWCERAQEFLLRPYLAADPDTFDLVVGLLQNNSRDMLLAEMVQRHEKNDDVLTAIAHFRKCFSICLENRNILMHSVIAPNEFLTGNPLTFYRRSKVRGQPHLFLNCDPVLIANTAREFMSLFAFGMRIWKTKTVGEPLPSLGRLPQPRKLALDPPAPPSVAPQPQSSEA